MKEKEEKKHNVAVYGSLRSGMYNRPHYKSLTTVEVITIPTYKMYSLGAFPFVVSSGSPEDSVVFELCTCNDRDYGYIRGMEIGAGYAEEVLSLDSGDWLVYLYPERGNYSSYTEVPSGDWVEYKN